MTRNDYREILLSKGFKFEKTTLAYPAWRGDEDVYTHKPEYKYTFRVFRISKDKPDYGLYVGIGDQFKHLNSIVEHNIDGGDNAKPIPLWTGDSFVKLMQEIHGA